MLFSDRYLIAECLRDAGWYRVYRAECLQRRREVVLKHLDASYPDPAMLAAFRAEYRILQQLDVEAVGHALALETYGRQLILVREYFPGVSLSDHAGRGLLPLGEVLAWISLLAETLGAIHEAGVVHGNLNPQDIVLDPARETFKLIGFGRARYHPDIKVKVPLPAGNIDYLAPEQCGCRDGEIDARADIYALGVIFFELSTGRRPFASDDALGLLHKQAAQAVPDPRDFRADLPEGLAHILARMLANDRNRRYATAFELLADLKLCRQALSAGAAFLPAAASAVLKLPERLYGRRLELERLTAAYRRSRDDGTVLALISGDSGVGKSYLIEAFEREALADNARFVAAKCDQYQANPPAQIFHEAFKQPLRQLLSEDDRTLAAWRSRLQTRLGDQAQAIIELLPELEPVLGPQPALQDLPSQEAKNRLLHAWGNFVSVFCEADTPLCLFLDDVQWAEPALFPWVERLLSDVNPLFVILAFRDGGIAEIGALAHMIAKARQDGLHVESLELSVLPESALSECV
ncbi:MAG: AAA family ATPase, partial [Methylomonas sp.]|nr:AAA family ATPase [Methylomonas sp.]